MSQSSNSEDQRREIRMCEGFFFFFFEELVTLLPSVSLDMKVMQLLWRSKLLPCGWNAIVCQTKGMVSWHPLVCTHDQHFQIKPSDLNLRFHSAQKTAGGFVSGEKSLGMSKPEPRHSHPQTRALIMSSTSKLHSQRLGEPRFLFTKALKVTDVWRLSLK